MASQVLHSGVVTPSTEEGETQAEDFRIVRLSERHGPLESEFHTASIWIKGKGGPINQAVELRRCNTNQGLSKFGLSHDEMDALAVAYLESLSEEEYARLMESVQRPA